MCIDYTDLNEACPKDSFPFLCIDQIVGSAARHGILSLFDAFSGYLKITMHPPDAEKKTFITPVGSYTLNKLDGTPVPRVWNAMHLKRYY